ncbi:hypothetical protein ACSMXM_01390 [Pacificimonas sp. ICDLI1SI03]
MPDWPEPRMIGFGLKMLGWGKALGSALKAIWLWLWYRPSRMVAFVLLLAFLWAHGGKRAAAERAERAIANTEHAIKWARAERTAHLRTKENYRVAQKVAAQMDRANVARVESEADARIEEVLNENAVLRSRLDADTTDWLRRRREAGRAAGSAGGPAPVPGVPGAAERTGAAAAGTVLVEEADLYRCNAFIARTRALQDAWRGVAAIDVNAAEGASDTIAEE